MMLLFDPKPPFVRWHSFGRGTSEEHTQRFRPNLYRNEFENMKSKKTKAIGYLLYHGGEEITEPLVANFQANVRFEGPCWAVDECVGAARHIG